MMPLRLFKKCGGTGNSKNLEQTNSRNVSANDTAEMEAGDTISFPESCSSHQLLQSPEPDDSMELISTLQKSISRIFVRKILLSNSRKS